MRALISVIVPVYNVEQYLEKCLDSLLVQTYKNIEVIMVDDGSKDSSGKICDEYAKQNKTFHVIHKENAGLGMARNTGLEYMNGEYVMFLDSDDYLENDCIENLYMNLLENDVDMCKCGFKRVVDSGSVIAERKYEKKVFKGDYAKKELLPRMIGSSPFEHDSIEMCVWGAIYKTEWIKKYGLKFPSERTLISEDLVFNIDYMQYANGACVIDYIGYNYRVNLNSLSASYRPDRFEASKFFYLEMKRKLQGLSYGNDTMLRLDRMFFVYLRMCIGQEKPIVSHNCFIDSIKVINKICVDDVVYEVIEKYPRKKIGVKQRFFLCLIKNKMCIILYCLVKLGIV